MTITSVLIVHRSPVFRRGLRALLTQTANMHVIGDEVDPESVLACVQTKCPDVVLFDGTLELTHSKTIDLATRICQRGSALFVFAPDVDAVGETFRLPFVQIGALACELPSIDPGDLIEKICRVARGESLMLESRVSAPPLASVVSGQRSSSSIRAQREKRQAAYQISERSVEILKLAMKGFSNKEIAEKCLISDQTVKNHFTRIFRLLHVPDRTSAVAIALRYELLSLDDVDVSEPIKRRGICVCQTFQSATMRGGKDGADSRIQAEERNVEYALS